MGLLRSVDNVPGIHYYEYRDMDYFNKFKYRARVILPGVRFTYWVKTIDEWREKVRKVKTWNRAYTPQEKVEMLNMSPSMEKFIDLKNNLKKNKNASMRIEGDTAAIFSNDLQFLQDIKTWANNVDFTEAICAEYKGIKYFVGDPPHKYRVYFKSKRIENNIYTDLGSLLSKNKSLSPSNAMEKWLFALDNKNRWKSFYLSSAYFIDYDDESTLSYLAIMHGDLLGRKYKLEKRPDTE